MNWIDRILDNISKFGVRKITKLEKDYLDNFSKEKGVSLLEQLNTRTDYYNSLYTYDIKNLSWLDNKLIDKLTDEEILFARLNLLWDNFEAEDCYLFQSIYDVPDRVINKTWNEIPKKYKQMFDNYWKDYYKF
jgi:arsenate reductase-like glutaredoxin family protein